MDDWKLSYFFRFCFLLKKNRGWSGRYTALSFLNLYHDHSKLIRKCQRIQICYWRTSSVKYNASTFFCEKKCDICGGGGLIDDRGGGRGLLTIFGWGEIAPPLCFSLNCWFSGTSNTKQVRHKKWHKLLKNGHMGLIFSQKFYKNICSSKIEKKIQGDVNFFEIFR